MVFFPVSDGFGVDEDRPEEVLVLRWHVQTTVSEEEAINIALASLNSQWISKERKKILLVQV